MTARCRCASCRFIDKVQRVQRKLSKRDAAVIEELLHKWAHEGMDAVYYRHVFKNQGERPCPAE